MPYHKNVFINCPFDAEYYPLLRHLLFTVLYLGFKPRLAQTQSSGKIRIDQIMGHIENSKFGIHDLSRSRPVNAGEYPRFNMPFELGLDVGCHRFGGPKHKNKKIIILERDQYHYQRILSDIAGQDIFSHNNDGFLLVTRVRDWFSIILSNGDLAAPDAIHNAYTKFEVGISERLERNGYTIPKIDNLPVGNFISFVKDWLDRRAKSRA